MLKKEYKYKLEQKKKDVDIVAHVWECLSEGDEWKAENIDSKIVKWKEAFNKALYGNESDNRSKFVDSTVKNYVNNVVTSMLEPLVNTNDIISFSSNSNNPNTIKATKDTEALINYQYTRKMDRYNLTEASLKLLTQEGFLCTRVFWDYRTKEILAKNIYDESKHAVYKNVPALNMGELIAAHKLRGEEPVDTTENEDGTLNATFIYNDLISERPDVEIVPIENMCWEPSATNVTHTEYDCSYIIEKRFLTESEIRDCLRNDSSYKSFDDDDIEEMIKAAKTNFSTDSPLDSYRETKSGVGEIYKQARENVKGMPKGTHMLLDFYGLVDIDEDGIDEMVHIEVFGDKVIKIEMNPYINNMIPYNIACFDKDPLNVNGDSIPEFLLDIQKVRSAVMRNILDSLSYDMLQNYVYEEGTFSPENRRRLNNLKPGQSVEARRNSKGTLKDKIMPLRGSGVGRDYYNVYENMEKAAQENSGVNAYTQGMDSRALNQTATGVSITTGHSMKKIWRYTQNYIERVLKSTIKAFIIMDKMFLEGSQFVDAYGTFRNVSKDIIDVDADIDINIVVKGMNQEKVGQMIQFLNLTQPLTETQAVPADIISDVISEIAESWEMRAISNKIKIHSQNIAGMTQPPIGNNPVSNGGGSPNGIGLPPTAANMAISGGGPLGT